MRCHDNYTVDSLQILFTQINAAEIQVQSARVVPERGSPAEAERILYDEPTQTVILALSEPLPAGRAWLPRRPGGAVSEPRGWLLGPSRGD